MQLEPIRAVLTAESAQFVAGMNRAHGAVANLSVSSGRSTRAMNILKSGMVGLATQATGTQGPVGKLAQALLMFGGGGPLVIGVAAGVGALALVYRGLTRDTRETEEAQKNLIKALQGVGVHAQLTAAKMKLSMLRTLQEAGQTAGGVFSQFLSDMTGGMFGVSGPEQRQRIARDIATTTNEIAAASQAVAKWQAQIAADANREAEARIRSLMALDKMAAKMPSKEAVERLNAEQRLKELSITDATKHDFEDPGAKMRYGLEQAGLPESVRNFGISIGRQFALGMLEGIQSMQDLFKMVIMSVLDFALGSLLGSIFPVPNIGGGIKGSAPSGSVVAPATMGLSLSGMPAASTPMAAARDAQWQAFLRESVLVAASQGFRGGK